MPGVSSGRGRNAGFPAPPSRTDPYVRNYLIRLLPPVMTLSRSEGWGHLCSQPTRILDASIPRMRLLEKQDRQTARIIGGGIDHVERSYCHRDALIKRAIR
jgi:hypothetical protein